MPFPLGLYSNINLGAIFKYLNKSCFPYCKCYIWKQSLKGVPWNMCSLKLGKRDNGTYEDMEYMEDTNTLQWQARWTSSS